MQFIKPIPFQEAIDTLGAKSIIGSQLNSEQWGRVAVGIRNASFFSSQVEHARFLQRAKDGVADFLQGALEEITLPDGTKTTALKNGSRADFVKHLQSFAIREGMGPVDPADQGTIKDVKTETRLNLIFDTQVRMAQDYGWWKQGMDADVLNAFPAQRFIREREVKEPRDFHHLHEGEVQLKTDIGFWTALNQDFGNPYGPWGWGCGHDVEDVDRAEAERLGLVQPGQDIAPVDKQFEDGLQAGTATLDDDLVNKLRHAFRDHPEIEFDGNTIRWNNKGDTHERTAQPIRTGGSPSGRFSDQAPDLPRRVGEAARRVFDAVRSGDARIPFDPEDAEAAGAHIAAVATGRKPLYHEQLLPGTADALAVHLREGLPRNVEIRAKDSHLYVYRPDVVESLVTASPGDYPGDSLFDQIERATLSGSNGQLLGYGAWTFVQPGTVLVTIFNPSGRAVAGFRSLREHAEQFAIERVTDFADAYGSGYSYQIRW